MTINLILFLACLAILYYLSNGAIYVPTDQHAVATIVRLLAIRPGLKVADLGSGDGRIVIALAHAGVQAVGYENNPVLFLWSWFKIKRANLANAKIYFRSFWSQDLSEYDAIVVFGMTHIMARLQKKLEKELKPGAVVISNIYKFPGWTSVTEEGGVRVYKC